MFFIYIYIQRKHKIISNIRYFFINDSQDFFAELNTSPRVGAIETRKHGVARSPVQVPRCIGSPVIQLRHTRRDDATEHTRSKDRPETKWKNIKKIFKKKKKTTLQQQ